MRFILILSLLLAGCAGTQGPISLSLEDERQVRFDERLLVPCDETLDDIKDNPKPSDVVAQHASDATKYQDCARNQRALVKAVKKAFNQ